jgi:hypothetical protein
MDPQHCFQANINCILSTSLLPCHYLPPRLHLTRYLQLPPHLHLIRHLHLLPSLLTHYLRLPLQVTQFLEHHLHLTPLQYLHLPLLPFISQKDAWKMNAFAPDHAYISGCMERNEHKKPI